MQHVILLDRKITLKEFENWKREDAAFWKDNTGITPSYAMLRYDYTDYPTEIDSDGDIRAHSKWLQSLTDGVVSIYGDFGVDFIMVVIHEDNWKSDPPGPGNGIWGTNYSYRFGKQHLQYCRWDRDNPANSFGTLYHERHHALDALVRQEVGLNVEPLLSVPVGKYDRCVTHAKCGGEWKYIRYQQNARSLFLMRHLLRKAFEKRRLRHKELDGNEASVIRRALNLLYYIIKMQFNKKDGVKKD